MKKSITVDKMIEELRGYSYDGYGELEVFVENPSKSASFDGITRPVLVVSAKDDFKFVTFLADGDILNL